MTSRIVSALADSALLLPASVFVLGCLVAFREARLALAFALALALTGSATIAAKILFHACGRAITDLAVTSPSGHASFATIFYGGLAIVLGTGRPAWVKTALAIGTPLFLVAVAASRVRTGVHTPAEVAFGLGIGGVALAAFAILHARTGRRTLPWLPVAGGFALALVLVGGAHLSLEHRIGGWARRLTAAIDVCPEPDRDGASRKPAGPG